MNLQLYPSWLRPQRPTFEGSVRGIKWDSDGTVRRSTRPRVVVVDGVQYASVNKAAKALGVSYMTMLRRLA